MMFFTEEKKNETHIEFPTAKIEEIIGYSFKIKGLLLQAFTRSSYAEEHNNDLRYVEYNKQFEERERALQDEDKKKKRKKPPKMFGE